MSSPSPSEPEDEEGIDLDSSIPATWGVVGTVLVAHAVTAMRGVADVGWFSALFLERSVELRIAAGGQYAPRMDAAGEWWRLATSVLLHADALHLTLNAIGLYALGRLVEPWVGGRRLAAWFVAGGVGGSITSHLVGLPQSDGASGGAFALMGAAVVLGHKRRETLPPRDRRLVGPILWGFLALNLVLSVAIPFIDAAGHLGGLVVGVVAAALLDREHVALRAVEWAVLGGFVAACLWGWLG